LTGTFVAGVRAVNPTLALLILFAGGTMNQTAFLAKARDRIGRLDPGATIVQTGPLRLRINWAKGRQVTDSNLDWALRQCLASPGDEVPSIGV
jgi:hypothetical protein